MIPESSENVQPSAGPDGLYLYGMRVEIDPRMPANHFGFYDPNKPIRLFKKDETEEHPVEVKFNTRIADRAPYRDIDLDDPKLAEAAKRIDFDLQRRAMENYFEKAGLGPQTLTTTQVEEATLTMEKMMEMMQQVEQMREERIERDVKLIEALVDLGAVVSLDERHIEMQVRLPKSMAEAFTRAQQKRQRRPLSYEENFFSPFFGRGRLEP